MIVKSYIVDDAMRASIVDYIGRVHAAQAHAERSRATMLEALRLMRDTTQSQEQHDRAVEALKYYGGRK